MSVEHMAVVLHHSKAKGTAKLILLGIANHQGDGGAWPSLATLAKYANVDRRNAQRALEKLRADGEVRVHVQSGGTSAMEDHDRPNLYEVTVICPPWCDRSPSHRDTRARQAPLWTNRAAQTPPPGADAAPRAAQTPPPRAAQTPPEPAYLTNPESHVPREVTTDRARDSSMCDVCSLERWDCERRDPAVTGHHFTPATKEARSA